VKIAVIGSRGQLGGELCRKLDGDVIGLDRTMLDITDRNAVLACLAHLRPHAVINTAAYTLVDRAEEEPDVCESVNSTAVGYLAEACADIGAVLVQVSTDYVFGRSSLPPRPCRENDAAEPLGVYACSKWRGEQMAARCPKHFIVRTCGLYGRREAGQKAGNFVATMLRLGRERSLVRVVDDQICSPSYVPHVAQGIGFLLSTDAYGIFHVVNSGRTSWFEFASEIFRQSRIQTCLEPITTQQYGARAPRPAYSALDTAKYRALGGPMLVSWVDALAEYLRDCGVTTIPCTPMERQLHLS
jgi:dTDP-4-dehydrorhamnose reductase